MDDPNPYSSPSATERIKVRRGLGTLMLRFLALALWLAAALLALFLLASVTLLEEEDLTEVGINPVLAAIAGVVVLAMPAAGLTFLGVAAWWRIRWVAVLGAATILPGVIWVVSGLLTGN